MNDERCGDCGGRFDRPGLFACKANRHPKPTMAQRIVASIERDLSDRRGLQHEWESIDADTQDEIRDEWSLLIAAEIRKGA